MAESCSCVWVPDYGVEVGFYDKKYPTARKEHKCYECRREILSGEKYESVSSSCEGSIYRYKTCLDCVSIRDSFFCDGFYHGGIWDDLQMHVDEHLGEIPSDCLVDLTPKARERVCELIESCWERYYDDDE